MAKLRTCNTSWADIRPRIHTSHHAAHLVQGCVQLVPESNQSKHGSACMPMAAVARDNRQKTDGKPTVERLPRKSRHLEPFGSEPLGALMLSTARAGSAGRLLQSRFGGE